MKEQRFLVSRVSTHAREATSAVAAHFAWLNQEERHSCVGRTLPPLGHSGPAGTCRYLEDQAICLDLKCSLSGNKKRNCGTYVMAVRGGRWPRSYKRV